MGVGHGALLILAALASASLVGTVPDASAGARTGGPDAVVALVDTGINPYHVTFRDDSPRARRHPSTYIPGYPKDAEALRLTLKGPDYWEAVRADCKRVWSQMKPGKLYWFPGTKIIGAISFSDPRPINCDQEKPFGGVIRDQNGHGTMVASRAASVDYGACKACRIVAIQFPGTATISDGSPDPSIDAIRWAGDNAGWIDIQSNSWGPFVPAWEPTGRAGLFTANPELVTAVEEVSSAHLALWASGNGAAFRGGVAGHPTLLTPHFTPSAVVVGGHDSGQVNLWPGFPPHVVSDSCASWAALPYEVSESGESVGSGTSAATPFAAGGAARILLEARRILGSTTTGVRDGIVARGKEAHGKAGPLDDGKLTLEEWKELTLKTATARPEAQHEDGPPCGLGPYGPTPLKWSEVPDGYPEYLHIGYGAIDSESFALARRVLAGKKEVPDRSATDEYFARDRQIRAVTHRIFTGP